MQFSIRNKLQATSLYLVIIAIAFGLFLRLTHLDYKIPSHDEVFTALRVSGYSEAELVQDLSSNPRPVPIDYIRQKYQAPNAEKSVSGTISGLAKEEPQLSPLYYITVKLWANLWGGAIAVLRSWSAVLSLLAFPCMYWLCLELFRSQFTAVLGVVILSVSPLYLSYSQDARHYSLWTVSILFMSAALLRAMRVGTKTSWVVYALSFAISLYAGLLSVLVIASQLIYVFIIEKFKFTKTLISYLLASIAGGLTFLPWLLMVLINWTEVRRNTSQTQAVKLSLLELARNLTRKPGTLLYDLHTSLEPSFAERLMQYLVTGISLVFVFYVLYVLYRTTEKQVWLFVLLLIGVTVGGLVLQDLTLGGYTVIGGMSNIPQYLTPCFVGIELATAHLFSYHLTQGAHPSWRGWMWRVLLVLFVVSQIINSTIAWQAKIWTLQADQGPFIPINLAAFNQVNQSQHAVVVMNSRGWDVMYLSQFLKPDVQLWTKPACSTCSQQVDTTNFHPDPSKSFDQFQTIFLFPTPSKALLKWAEKQTNFEWKEIQLLPNREEKLIQLERRLPIPSP
jgi:uncharacterized membrane protein